MVSIEPITARMSKEAVRALTMQLDEQYRIERDGDFEPREQIDLRLLTYAA